MPRLLLLASALLSSVSVFGLSKWMDPNDSPRQRALTLLAEMTQAEKVKMLHGAPIGIYIGNVAPIPRLGIPPLNLNDGPQGFRAVGHAGTSTQWPSGLSVSAAFDTDLMLKWGDALGKEFFDKGANVLLGPGLNVARVPTCGRNFEYVSGEDPFLGSEMVRQYVQGVQNRGVMANAKHYVHNNQETNRNTISAVVDERTQWDIYYPPFQAAVDAGVQSIMCSYNKVNSIYACENNQTLNTDLKTRMGFQGWVVSDWGADHSLAPAANAGLDMQMPLGTRFGQLGAAVANGEVSQERLDDMVVRVLTSMFDIGIFDRPYPTGNLTVNVTSVEHRDLAELLSASATVLLKNTDALLPIAASTKSIAVIGNAGLLHPIVGGGGSGQVEPSRVIAPFSAIQARAGTGVSVTYSPSSPLADAVAAAAAADIAIVFVGITSSEGSDRKTLSLSKEENALIEAVAAAQANTVVAISCPGAVLLPWADKVKSILVAFMPGQEFGGAISSLLFGDRVPSGRLPVTFPNMDNEIAFTPDQYPGVDLVSTYSEKYLVGYRWYDSNKVAPLFPFGHGLSYSTFTYSGDSKDQVRMRVSATNISIAFDVKNEGDKDAAEVAQLYLTFPPSAGLPPLTLKGFAKHEIVAQQSMTYSLTLTATHTRVWDTTVHAYVQVPGVFNVSVGASSRDLRLFSSFVNPFV